MMRSVIAPGDLNAAPNAMRIRERGRATRHSASTRYVVVLRAVTWFIALDAAALGAQERRPSPLAAFAIEFAGAATASGIGYGIISELHPACQATADVVSCSRSARYLWMLGATVVAPIGAVVAGRVQHTDPSVAGAMLGSVAGLLVAAGIDRGIRRHASRRLDRGELGVLLMLTQGAATSAGSRLFAMRMRSSDRH